MSEIIDGLYYSKEDEWIKVEDGVGTIGITDYAQDSLSDIVYVELPAEDDSFEIGEVFGVVESVKAAGDLYMPVSGTVIAVNEDLPDEPEILNSDPYNAGWMIKISIDDADELADLMDAAAYKDYCESRG